MQEKDGEGEEEEGIGVEDNSLAPSSFPTERGGGEVECLRKEEEGGKEEEERRIAGVLGVDLLYSSLYSSFLDVSRKCVDTLNPGNEKDVFFRFLLFFASFLYFCS